MSRIFNCNWLQTTNLKNLGLSANRDVVPLVHFVQTQNTSTYLTSLYPNVEILKSLSTLTANLFRLLLPGLWVFWNIWKNRPKDKDDKHRPSVCGYSTTFYCMTEKHPYYKTTTPSYSLYDLSSVVGYPGNRRYSRNWTRGARTGKRCVGSPKTPSHAPNRACPTLR